MEITIVGAGYAGLVTGACLAEFGHVVTCVDLDASKIDSLNQGKCPLYEPGLDKLLENNLQRKRLFFTTNGIPSIKKSEVVFIAVGTPSSRRGNGYADISYVYDAARSLAPHLKKYTVIVNKSTVPVGTARQVKRILAETNPSAEFDMASNPEFLREGAAIYEFMHPDRVVIGVDSPRAEEIMKRVYRPLYLIETPFIVTNFETAELIKYASNAFLATKISFINEMANLCEVAGGDIQAVAKGMGMDKRIGSKFLHAGPGFGGSCLPKDATALIRMAQEYGSPCRIVETILEVNHAQRARAVAKIRQALEREGEGQLAGKTLAVLGLTFKPESDDMREAPSLSILPALLEKGVKIRVHDPEGMEEAKRHLAEVEFCPDPYAACKGADAVCLMTEWNSYRAMDLKALKSLLKRPVFIDLRNVYQPALMKEAGYYYVSVGRETVDGSFSSGGDTALPLKPPSVSPR